jgi:2-polyprenyl-3-methyl-5-hydroxy-6-metoxy-1,4-benzoquinol methylase
LNARLEHPPLLVFLLGGAAGAALNLAVTLALRFGLGWTETLAFFLGTIVGQLFHYLYYNFLYVNREIRLRTPFLVNLGLYTIVAAGATAGLHLVRRSLGWPLVPSLLAVLALLSVLNSLINRISTFSSAALAEVEYRNVGESFYDDQTDPGKVSRFRAWYHRSRYERLKALIASVWRPGTKIVDLGCGNCWWNTDGIPVLGLDVNEKMLQWARRHGRLAEYRIESDLSRTGLPDRTFDIVVCSETLEHLLNFEAVLEEIRRILKDDGTLVVTVPWDFFLGPFFVLFNLNCLFMAFVKGSRYHLFRCGHVNHFTRKRLKKALGEAGFEMSRLFVVNAFLLYGTARKTPVSAAPSPPA